MGPGPVNADPRVLRAMSAAHRPVRPGHDRVHDRDHGAVPRGLRDGERGDPAGRRHVARGDRGGDRLARPPRPARAGAGVRPVRAPAGRDRAARAGRGAHHRGAVGPGVPASGRRGGDRPRPAAPARDGAGRHVDDDEPAAGRARRDLREARRAALRRRHRVPGRQPVRDGRVGHRRRHRRAAEVPVRPVGERADQPVRPRGRGDPRPRRIEAGIREESDEDTANPCTPTTSTSA